MGEAASGAQVVASFAVDLARHGHRPALRADGEVVTHAELDRRVAAARDALTALTPATGRHLVRLAPEPTVDFVVAWLAALTGGHATLLSRDPALGAAYASSVEYDASGWIPTGTPAPALHPDLRLLLSTSGSTGSPKLVRLSAANLDANAAAIASYLGLREDDVALTTLPLDYCYGLSVLHSHLAAGASVLLDDRSVTEPGLWADARAHGVTSFAGVPYTFDLLGAAGWPALPSLRQVTQAGGRMAPERVRTLAARGEAEGWELVVMYGQTEATARMAYLPPHLATTHPESVGVAIPGGSFRLAPVAGAEPGVGELVYAGPNVMMGYAESPADLARGAELAELRTGDLARISEDGLVEIVGRRSRFAKLFGQRIDLDRVQTLLGLGGHEVGCAEAVDAEQLVVAVPGDPDAHVLAEVAATVAGDTGLPPHAVRVVAVADLPRLPNGKLDQQAVSLLEARPDPDPGSPVRSLVTLFGRVLGRDVVGPQDSFVTLGGDSLSYVELSLRLERRLGRLPADWHHRTIADLALLDALLDVPAGGAANGVANGVADGPADGAPVDAAAARRRRRHRRYARVDTTIPLRALAIVLIVGSHTDLWVLVGGAHVLLAVAGANFARFHLTDEGSRERLRRVRRAATRIAVPSVLWIGAVHVVTGAYPWRSVLLLNDLLGGRHWSEPAWHFWFVEVVLLLALGAGLLTAIPAVMALERRHRFGLAAGLTAIALVPRLWAGLASYDGDVIHSSLFVAWLFTGGWAAAVARDPAQRTVAALLLLVGAWDFTGDAQRDLVIVAGLMALVWLPTVPWPRVLVGATGTLASASLYIYLTHWQVYPRLEDHWPLGGLIASLAVGVVAWRAVERVQSRTGARRGGRPRPHYARQQLTRQEVR